MIDRKYLTFAELVERWGCEKKDVHYLVSERDLVPSIAWSQAVVSCQWEPEAAEPGTSYLREVRDENGCSERIYLQGWVYLQRPVITGPFDNYRFKYVSYDKIPSSVEFCPGVLYRLRSDGEYSYVTGLDVENDGVFMMDEIIACETIWHPSIGNAMDKRKQSDGKQSIPSTESAITTAITGAIFDRLQRAILIFPTRYPDYQTRPPKLDVDVRPWLKESGLGENDAERRVFGAIIREHFKLSPDTLKNQ